MDVSACVTLTLMVVLILRARLHLCARLAQRNQLLHVLGVTHALNALLTASVGCSNWWTAVAAADLWIVHSQDLFLRGRKAEARDDRGGDKRAELHC